MTAQLGHIASRLQKNSCLKKERSMQILQAHATCCLYVEAALDHGGRTDGHTSLPPVMQSSRSFVLTWSCYSKRTRSSWLLFKLLLQRGPRRRPNYSGIGQTSGPTLSSQELLNSYLTKLKIPTLGSLRQIRSGLTGWWWPQCKCGHLLGCMALSDDASWPV